MARESEIFLAIAKEMQKQSTYFFNLLDVLAEKHIINQADLEHIKDNKHFNELS